MSDYDDYKNARGFVFDNPLHYMPGNHMYDKNDLFSFVQDVIDDNDLHEADRKKIFSEVHNICDNYCLKIENEINKICKKEVQNMKKYKIGYTQGTFDLFHIGHLNLINNAKKYCDYLIVGVNSDELVMQYKNKKTNINENDRATIVGAIKGVDKVVITKTLDKMAVHKSINFDAIFIGDDWKGNDRWKKTEEELANINVDVVFLPHTDGISTTMLTQIIENK